MLSQCWKWLKCHWENCFSVLISSCQGDCFLTCITFWESMKKQICMVDVGIYPNRSTSFCRSTSNVEWKDSLFCQDRNFQNGQRHCSLDSTLFEVNDISPELVAIGFCPLMGSRRKFPWAKYFLCFFRNQELSARRHINTHFGKNCRTWKKHRNLRKVL